MKKILLISFALIIAFNSVCSAHSGRTDANGGHHVSGTGEYHFHHGYPAHQHTNGTCPYNFDDRTGENSGSSSGGSTSSSSGSNTPNATNPKSDKTSFGELLLSIVKGIPLLLFLCWILKSYIKSFVIDPITRKKKEAEERRLSEERLQAERENVIAQYSNKTRTQIAVACGMSPDFYIDENDLPHDIFTGETPDRCTVYIARNGSVYHRNPRCCQRDLSPVNITKVRHLNTCRYCAPDRIDLQWYNSYKEALRLMQKHGIEPVPETYPVRLS